MDRNTILLNPEQQFEKYKQMILETLIKYYGEENRNLITNRFNSILFDFSSSPDEVLKYIKNAGDISLLEIKKVIDMIKKYQKIKKAIFNEVSKNFFKEISEALSKEYGVKISKQELLNGGLNSAFFTEDFEAGFIMAFDKQNIENLNDPMTSTSIKEKIIENKTNYLNQIINFGINPKEPSIAFVDYVNQIREKYKIIFQEQLVRKSNWGQEIKKRFKKMFDKKITDLIITNFLFKDHGYTANITSSNYFGETYDRVVKIPVIADENKNWYKRIDVDLLHEIIHGIERNQKNVGIASYNTESDSYLGTLTNEIRTHMIALKLVKELHEQGIFIFDNPNDYKIEGGSMYEFLFPMTNSFFEPSEKTVNSCALVSDFSKLYSLYGEDNFTSFCSYIDSVYKIIERYWFIYEKNYYEMPLDDSIIDLNNVISEMNTQCERSRKI